MDAGTGLAVLGSAIGSAKLIEKILGPTADYVGEGLQNWAEKRVQNVGRIFEKAGTKLGEKLEGPGGVPPKALKEILDEGSYCDDELTAEYFGGVLASSRGGSSRDDRAASYLKLVSELSSYQVRFHFVAYATWRAYFANSGLRPTFGEDLEKMWLFLPYASLGESMAFSEDEPWGDILLHCMTGLERHSLIEGGHWGSSKHVCEVNKTRRWKEVTEPGLCIAPTQYGIDLWLWANGAGSTNRSCFLDAKLDLPPMPNVVFPGDAVKLHKGSL